MSVGCLKGLLEALESDDEFFRRGAAQAIGYIDPPQGKALPILIGHFEKRLASWESGRALLKFSDNWDMAIPALIDTVKTGDGEAPNIQGLINLLNHDDKQVQDAAIEALGVLDARAALAVPILMEMLEDDDTWPDSDIRKALGEILPSFEAIPYFVGILESGSQSGRAEAVKQLKKYVSGSDEALSAITAVLAEERSYAMKEAVIVLAEMGAGAVPVLIETISGESMYGKINAAKALTEMGAEASDAVGALIGMLDHPNKDVRRQAIETLVALGPASREALPKLRDLAENDQYVNTYSMKYTVRRAARDAIAKIEAMEEE